MDCEAGAECVIQDPPIYDEMKDVLTKFCRNGKYPLRQFDDQRKRWVTNSEFDRQFIRDTQVSWKHPSPHYSPYWHSDPSLSRCPIADQDWKECKFNSLEQNDERSIERRSLHGEYLIDDNGLPVHPGGRTGISGRGINRRFGPNHMLKPLIFRHVRDNDDQMRFTPEGQPVYEFLLMGRDENDTLGIPSYHVDSYSESPEDDCNYWAREFLNTNEVIKVSQIHSGWVDDYRNTDCAWIESTIVIFKIDSYEDSFDMVSNRLRWMRSSKWMNDEIYAPHLKFIEMAQSCIRTFAWPNTPDELFVPRFNCQGCREKSTTESDHVGGCIPQNEDIDREFMKYMKIEKLAVGMEYTLLDFDKFLQVLREEVSFHSRIQSSTLAASIVEDALFQCFDMESLMSEDIQHFSANIADIIDDFDDI